MRHPWLRKGISRYDESKHRRDHGRFATTGGTGRKPGPEWDRPAAPGSRHNPDLDAAMGMDKPAAPPARPADLFAEHQPGTQDLRRFPTSGARPPRPPSAATLPALPHERTRRTALHAAESVRPGDAQSHSAAVQALDAHLKAGLAELKRRAAHAGPRGGNMYRKAATAFRAKLSAARARVDAIAGKGPPALPRRPGRPPPLPGKGGPRLAPWVPLKAFHPWLAGMVAKSFNEGDHPRDDAGKFTTHTIHLGGAKRELKYRTDGSTHVEHVGTKKHVTYTMDGVKHGYIEDSAGGNISPFVIRDRQAVPHDEIPKAQIDAIRLADNATKAKLARRREFEKNVGHMVLSASRVAHDLSKAGIPIYKNTKRDRQAGASIKQVPGKRTWLMVEWMAAGEQDTDFDAKSKDLEKHLSGHGYTVTRPFPDKTILAIRKAAAEEKGFHHPWLVTKARDVAAQSRDDGGRWTRWGHVADALRAAHPHAGPRPPLPPGLVRDDLRAADPALRAAADAFDAHTAADHRHRLAGLVGRLLTEPHRLVASGKAKKSRAVRAVEDYHESLADHALLSHPAWQSHRAAVAGSHPEGATAVEEATVEAARRVEAARANAERHVAGLEGADRERGTRDLRRFDLTKGVRHPWIVKAAHDVSGEARDEGGKWTAGGRKLSGRGDSPAPKAANLTAEVGAMRDGDSDPRGYEGTKPDADTLSRVADAVGPVVASRVAKTTVGLPIADVYDRTKGELGLSPHEFHAALYHLHHAGRVRLGGWPKTVGEMPRPEHALPMGSRHMYYVWPGAESKSIRHPWLVTKGRDATGHEHAADGRFGSGGGRAATAAPMPSRTTANGRPAIPARNDPDAKARSLAARIGEVPAKLRTQVASFVRGRYRRLSGRYGPKGAAAILGATILLLPAPVPGSSLIPIAVAEVVLALRRIAKTHDELDDATIHREAVVLLRSLYAHCGEADPKGAN